MVDLLHQLQQAPGFIVGEAFAGKPVEVRAGQVGEQPALVLAVGHGPGYQQKQVFGLHGLRLAAIGGEDASHLAGLAVEIG